MPTTKKRINITLSKEMEEVLSALAQRDNVPEATKAASLLELALEIEEDEGLDALARSRDTKGAVFLTHDEVWGKSTR